MQTFLAFVVLMLAQAASTPTGNTPFFTNDVVGFLKVLGTFGTMLGVMIGLVVKLTQGKYTERQTKIETDIDGLGQRLNTAEGNCTRISEAQRSSELTVRDHTNTLADHARDIGELLAGLAAQEKHADGLHRDVMGTLLEISDRFNTAQNGLEVQIARLQEQHKLADSLARIATSMERRERDG